MSIIVSAVTNGLDSERYEAVIAKVMPGDQLPDGCEFHVAGPVEGGWRVITVWESTEDFTQFRENKLLPAIREIAGDQAPVAAEPEINEVYKLVTA